MGKAARQKLAEKVRQFHLFILLFAQEFECVVIWQQVDSYWQARYPVGRDLQNRRSTQPAMCDENVFAKLLVLTTHGGIN